MQIKQAMVLAAGYGTRLRPVTLKTPKPLLCLAGETLLDHILKTLQDVGITRIVVNTHYLAEQVHDHLKAYPSVVISHEETLLETGGGVLNALSYFEGKPFFTINSDTYWHGSMCMALKRLDETWNQSLMDILMVLVPRAGQVPGDYFLSPSGLLAYRGRHEKAPYVYSGLSVRHPRHLETAEPGPFSAVPYFHKAEEKQRLYGIVHEGFWGDIGTLDSFHDLQQRFGT